MDIEDAGKMNGKPTYKEDVNPRSPVVASGGGLRPLMISKVELKIVGESLKILQEFKEQLELVCVSESDCSCRVIFKRGELQVFEVVVRNTSNVYQAGTMLVFLRVSQGSAVIATSSMNDTGQLMNYLHTHVAGGQRKLTKQSVFNLRTEEGSAKQYFQFYGYLSQQQNMMQDYTRTATYQSAMLQNMVDFEDKVVLDVGAGTGILSFFSVQAGAKKVYAVEASSMSVYCSKLIKENKLSNKITVIAGKVEEVVIPEKVDVIISEPMGYMLYNERMLESFIHAKKWLKPGGKMYPTKGVLYVAPFSDEQLHIEQCSKAFFWSQTSFHGIDLSSLRTAALEEYFRQPILDTFDVRIIMAKPVGHTTDFTKAQETDLHKVTIPFTFSLWYTGIVHGLAFWFDVAFCGSQTMSWLSTAPFQPLTHWYQIRCLLPQPFFARMGQDLTGTVVLTANERQSYDVDVEISVVGDRETIKSCGSYDLKNPNFRYMMTPPPPPGSHQVNPTEAYFDPNVSSPSYPMNNVQHGMPVVAQLQHQQLLSPVSAGGTVVVSALTPHPVMAVHATPACVPMVNGGLVAHGHTNEPAKSNSIHPLLPSPPSGQSQMSALGHSRITSPVHAGPGAMFHQTQFVYAASTTDGVGTSNNLVYKFHQVHPVSGGR